MYVKHYFYITKKNETLFCIILLKTVLLCYYFRFKLFTIEIFYKCIRLLKINFSYFKK